MEQYKNSTYCFFPVLLYTHPVSQYAYPKVYTPFEFLLFFSSLYVDQ